MAPEHVFNQIHRLTPMSEKTPANLTILLVEDDEDTRYLMRLELERRGYRLIEAEDGEKAVALAQKEHPDIILMDISLPRMDGLEAEPRRANPSPQRKAPSGPVSRILSLRRGRDHSSGPEVTLGLEQPTRRCPARGGAGRAPSISLFGLAPHGVCRAPSVAVGAVRSYRTVSPLPSDPVRERRAVCFLWHFPSRCRDRGLPGMPPVWSSDFPPRLPGAIAWPARSRGDHTILGWGKIEGSIARSPDYSSRFPSSPK